MKDNTAKLMTCHYILMCLMMIFGVIGLFSSFLAPGEPGNLGLRLAIQLFQLIGLGCGFVHLMSLYGKSAALFYKLLLVFTALSHLVYGCWILATYGLSVTVFVGFVCCALLLVLAFWPNLGKRLSWILYSIFLVLVLYSAIIGLISVVPGVSSALSYPAILAGTIGHAVAAGTIGLSLMGKYADKDARGTV